MCVKNMHMYYACNNYVPFTKCSGHIEQTGLNYKMIKCDQMKSVAWNFELTIIHVLELVL